MIRYGICLLMIFSCAACARVSVETTKPIKVDVSMRIDVYQHVVKDVQSIEDQIYGNQEQQLNFFWSMESVYAQDLPTDVVEAIARRKGRVSRIELYLAEGYMGIDRAGYITLRETVPASLRTDLSRLAAAENSDRRITNSYTAKKNGVPLSQVENVMSEDSFKRAPAGYWFEMKNASGSYVWKQK